MTKFLGALCLSLLPLAACASGTRTTRIAVPTDTSQVFPTAKNPQLPSVDRISGQVRSGLGEVASADVRLCIAPDGRVAQVHLVRGSSLEAFDDAVLHDAAEWQFSAMPGSSSSGLRSCQVTTISYRPRP